MGLNPLPSSEQIFQFEAATCVNKVIRLVKLITVYKRYHWNEFITGTPKTAITCRKLSSCKNNSYVVLVVAECFTQLEILTHLLSKLYKK